METKSWGCWWHTGKTLRTWLKRLMMNPQAICDSTVRATFMNLREISVRFQCQEMDISLGSQCMTNCKFCHKRTSRQFYWCLSTACRCGKNSFILFFPCINTLIIGQVNASSSFIKFGGDERPCVHDMREWDRLREAKAGMVVVKHLVSSRFNSGIQCSTNRSSSFKVQVPPLLLMT